MRYFILASILLLSGCCNSPLKENRIEVMRADGYTDSCIFKVLATYGVSKDAYADNI